MTVSKLQERVKVLEVDIKGKDGQVKQLQAQRDALVKQGNAQVQELTRRMTVLVIEIDQARAKISENQRYIQELSEEAKPKGKGKK